MTITDEKALVKRFSAMNGVLSSTDMRRRPPWQHDKRSKQRSSHRRQGESSGHDHEPILRRRLRVSRSTTATSALDGEAARDGAGDRVSVTAIRIGGAQRPVCDVRNRGNEQAIGKPD